MIDRNSKMRTVGVVDRIGNGVASSGKMDISRWTFHWLITKSNQANLTVLASLRDLLGIYLVLMMIMMMMMVCHYLLYLSAKIISKELGILLWHRIIQNF